MYLGARFLIYLSGFEKPVGFAVWKGCLLITAVVTGHRASLSGELRRGDACRKAFADIADVGACQLYGRFSDQTGFASALVLDGIGGAVSFGCGVFRLPSGDAAMQTGGKKRKLWLWVVLAALFALSFLPESLMEHSVCGLPFRLG